MANNSKTTMGGTYIKKADYLTHFKQLNADLEILKKKGIRLLEKQHTDENEPIHDIYFNAIMSMIANAEDIKCISMESLSGFIFHVKSSKSYFKRMVGDHEEDVYELILKMSILSKKPFFYSTGIMYGPSKLSIQPNVFYNEAMTQQKIYNLSSITSYQICPSLLDVSVFKTKKTKDTLIKLLKNIVRSENANEDANEDEDEDEDEYTDIEKILNNISKRGYTFSMMTMEYAKDFQTLDDFYVVEYEELIKTDAGKDRLYEIYGYIYSLKLGLYILTGIIHIDLHIENIMIHKNIKKEKSVKNKIYMIDFEKVVNTDIEFLSDKNVTIDTTLNERYLEFFESTMNPHIDYNAAKEFLEKYYKHLDEPAYHGHGIFSQDYFYHPIFKKYFIHYLKDMLRNIRYEGANELQIVDKDKLVIDSYSINVSTTKSKPSNQRSTRRTKRRSFTTNKKTVRNKTV
jgi:hypothetical protein